MAKTKMLKGNDQLVVYMGGETHDLQRIWIGKLGAEKRMLADMKECGENAEEDYERRVVSQDFFVFNLDVSIELEA